ncbi:FMN-binding glutamate synthase family protein [Mucilaginibacter sp. RS28]|uniref:FMN-binding glutamate synthase family protein n=1 Tax=Mucilaginibacter straminoryzae TaxID=2932774 RepID=A0A9X1X6M6_9SPHI|nr:FMN-binding glutamate synthase family protein [Mucilaginibacter straminoryzae]MCJ8211105.1 FMN-binding glutamate synthase family protein [Mucilaginibacter straminoryzae]
MRKLFIASALIIVALITAWSIIWPPALWSFVILGPILLIGVYDLFQQKHSIVRNFPVFGHLRFLAEELRPKIYQYFVESDTDGTPFNRQSRSVIYQRAKKVDDTSPFGTELDVYQIGYEWLNHSIAAVDHHELDMAPRVKVGGPQCRQPYSASVFNISAMSFGSLSENAVLALNGGARIGNFAHNTGEGGLSDYHLQPVGDVIWQIGTGYFSCRNTDGTFNYQAFAERAVLPQVKMIEIKLSQGAKPGHGGILPAAKVTPEIARIRLVEMGKDVLSPPYHTAFRTPVEMVYFIQKLRDLSEGKPVGFKLCVGHKSEFLAICKAMVKTGIYPDFITVDGGEGGTGAAPLEFSNSVGMPLREALAFVYDALVGFDLKKHIRIIASGKVATGFDLVKNFALGADMCNSARGMMFALGCIQALECNKNTCPTGVATQDKSLMKGLVVEDKKVRVANFQKETVGSAMQMIGAGGLHHPCDLNRSYIYRRVSPNQIQTYAELFPYIPKGSLLNTPYPRQFEFDMTISSENTFVPDFSRVSSIETAGPSAFVG